MTESPSKKRPRKLLPSLCRICLTGSYSMSKLSDFLDSENTILILNALGKVMGCEIVITRGVPNHLCSMCLSLLRISYDLRTQFEETQRKIWENIEKTTDDVPKTNVETKPNREVDLIYGEENYSLSDIIIVEDEECNEDYTQILQNLGETVSVECVEKKKDKTIESNNESNFNENSGTIVTHTDSDSEIKRPFHWEHEYAKPSPEPPKKVGRKYKFPELMDEINSFIIEGDIQNDLSFEEENMRGRRRQKFTNEEMKEIEKYIIYIGNENKPLKKSQYNENIETNKFTPVNNVIIKDFSLSELTKKHICNVCRVPFVTKSTLNRHLRAVHKMEVQKTKREKLPREIIKKRRLERMKQNYKKSPMLCQICGHISSSSGGARYHSLKHTGKQIDCDLCPRKFFTPSHLKHHRQMKHEHKTSKHLCPLCGEYRNSTTALAYHMKLHRNEERKFTCQICGLKFVVKSALTMHLRRHNGDRRYPCTYCSKSFFSNHDLRKHAMIHTGEKPHKCKYCDKSFITSFNKRVHTMTHDGPYECDYCDKCFIDNDVLNMHYKYKHQVSTGELQNIPSLSLTDDEDSNVSFNNPVPDAQILEGLELLTPEDDNLVFEED